MFFYIYTCYMCVMYLPPSQTTDDERLHLAPINISEAIVIIKRNVSLRFKPYVLSILIYVFTSNK